MIFSQLLFIPFLLLTITVYWSLPTKTQRKAWLIACSLCFYAIWNWRFIPLILGTTFVDYFAGNRIIRSSSARERKKFLILSLTSNLLVLAIFKYLGFMVNSTAQLISWLGYDPHLPVLQIILPVGISFHTFQGMSYTIDIYRRTGKPARNLADFTLYILFFPQLLAGPITRAKDFLGWIEVERRLPVWRIKKSLLLLLIGYFKKACVSDHLASVANVYPFHPEGYSVAASCFAIMSCGVQIYCDFSGYSDMAIGSAGLMGFPLQKNFAAPFLSASYPQLWSRWHMSLGSWFRDYLYIPLRGRSPAAQNPRGHFAAFKTLVITSFLTGLWHGANWTFAIWGLLNGLSSWIYKALIRPLRIFSRLENELAIPMRWLAVAFTFSWFCLIGIFFRVPTVDQGVGIYLRLLHVAPAGTKIFSPHLPYWLLSLAVLHILWNRYEMEKRLRRVPLALFCPGYGVAVSLAISAADIHYHPFLYYQF